MKRLVCFILILSVALLSVVCVSAVSATVKPFPSGTEAETMYTPYLADIPDLSTIQTGGYFTASLYNPDSYPLADIDGLQPGSTVQVDGQVFTVSSVIHHDDGSVEIYPKEDFDGYIVFQPDGEVYNAIVNDCAAATYVTDYRFMMPLPDAFRFYWLDPEDNVQTYDANGFTTLVTDSSAPSFTRGYSVVYFRNGQLSKVIFSDSPIQNPAEAVRLTALADPSAEIP